jgi:hypothetical protein
MRTLVVILLAVSLSACSIFGGKKTRLVPQAYMPEPPKILMEPPKDLKTIKKNNLEITEEKVSVNGPNQ